MAASKDGQRRAAPKRKRKTAAVSAGQAVARLAPDVAPKAARGKADTSGGTDEADRAETTRSEAAASKAQSLESSKALNSGTSTKSSKAPKSGQSLKSSNAGKPSKSSKSSKSPTQQSLPRETQATQKRAEQPLPNATPPETSEAETSEAETSGRETALAPKSPDEKLGAETSGGEKSATARSLSRKSLARRVRVQAARLAKLPIPGISKKPRAATATAVGTGAATAIAETTASKSLPPATARLPGPKSARKTVPEAASRAEAASRSIAPGGQPGVSPPRHKPDRADRPDSPWQRAASAAWKWIWRRPRAALRRAGFVWPLYIASKISWLFSFLTPKGLYARTLMIIITPIVLLEGVIAFVFMERHWAAVSRRLSEATARDIAALIEVYKSYPSPGEYVKLIELARDQMNLSLRILPAGELPAPQPKPFFAILDRTLSNQIRKQVRQPFWIDTVGQSRHVEIRVKLDNAILRFIALRSQTFASNSHIFLLWMVGTSIILLAVAILFLGNQIKPIVRLSEAAEAFGKGRPLPDDFRPRGAREVRQAALAFMEMRDRITTHVEQRTTMLAGVSHDLRTILTRFKLELALLGEEPHIRALREDVDEMQQMLEDYLAFSKGDGGEEAVPTKMRELLEQIRDESQHYGKPVELKMRRRRKDLVLTLKRNSFKRALTNLISNAARFGDEILIRATTEQDWLRIDIEDSGPGIAPENYEDVFKPFHRLDHARNQDEGNTGLGLAIARDIARNHGGDITLDKSQDLGGLKASLRVPI